MTRTLSYTETLELIHCGQCGVPFGLSDDFIAERRKDHLTWYCPNGHPRHYPAKNREEELAEKLAAEQRNSKWWRDRQMAEERARERAEHQRDAYKGHTTRLKKRVAKGKCPCCSNTFVNLAGHMAKRHPDFGVEPPGEASA